MMSTGDFILLVGSSAEIQRDLRQQLLALGYQITAAVTSGEQALKALKDEPVDIVLVDLHFGGELAGIRIAAKIKERQDISLLYLTSHIDQNILQKTEATHPAGFVITPTRPEELSAQIEVALHKHAVENKLSKELGRFQALCELLPDFAYSFKVKPQGGFSIDWVSDSLSRVLGYADGQVSFNQWLEFIHPDDRQGAIEYLQGVSAGQEGGNEIRVIDNNGDTRWLRTTNRPVWGPDGQNIAYIYGVAQDITGHKQAQAALKESEKRYQDTFELAAVGINHTDLAGRFTRVNRRFCEITGYSKDELYTLNYQDISHPDDRKANPQSREKILANDYTNKTLEKRYIRKDGAIVWVKVTLSLARTPSGEPVYFIGVVEDITERMQEEQALTRSEERFRMVFDYAPVCYQSLDTDANIVHINQAWLDMTGYEEDEVIGRGFGDLLAPGHKNLVETCLPKLITNGRVKDIQFDILRKDGERVHISLDGRVTYDAQGGVKQTYCVLHNITERVRVEKALRESEAQYRMLFESAPDSVMIVDSQGRIKQCNQGTEKLSGYPREEITGKHITELLTPKGVKVFQEKFPKAMKIEVVDGEVQILRKDGRIVEVWRKGYPLQDEQGNFSGVLAYDRDITKQVQAQEALRESEERFRGLVEESTDGILLADEKGKIIEWNQGYEEISGLKREDVLGKYLWDVQFQLARDELKSPALFKRIQAAIQTTLDTGEIQWTQAIAKRVIQRPDGSRPTIQSIMYPIQTTRGFQLGVIIRDISEQERTEREREQLLEQISEAAQQVRDIMDTVPEGVMLLNGDSRVLLANPAAQRDLRILAGAQVGDRLANLGDQPMHKLLTPPPQGLWHEVKAEGRTFEVIARPMAAGEYPEKWVLALRDVTDERKLQRMAQQQARLAAVGQLAAGIAHDFNNILAVILLYIDIISNDTTLSINTRQKMKTISEEAERAAVLVQQMLDFSRRSVLERRSLDLLPLLKEQTKLLQRTLPESIRVSLDYPKEKSIVKADPARLQQAVMNLAINSRDAMPEGGELTITLSRLPEGATIHCSVCGSTIEEPGGIWHRITVTDTGVGISEDALAHIFEPFYTTKPPGEGVGLGLAQVSGIISQHKGHIHVRSVQDQGTSFEIYLPALASTIPASRERPSDPLVSGRGETILVVEDAPSAQQALVDSLAILDYKAVPMDHGKQALDYLDAHPGEVDLVLSDVVMPEMGGIALFRAMQERGLSIPVVLMTGHPLGTKLEELQTKDLIEWVLKPLNFKQLAQTISHRLAKGSDR